MGIKRPPGLVIISGLYMLYGLMLLVSLFLPGERVWFNPGLSEALGLPYEYEEWTRLLLILFCVTIGAGVYFLKKWSFIILIVYVLFQVTAKVMFFNGNGVIFSYPLVLSLVILVYVLSKRKYFS